MVRIRLRRQGKKKQPSYRVVVADSTSPRDGRFIEIIGYYNPVRQPKILEIKADRARYWLGVGAQPSDTVAYLFKKVNVFDEAGKVVPAAEAQTTDTAPVAAPVAVAPAFAAPVVVAPAATAPAAAPVAETPTAIAPVDVA